MARNLGGFGSLALSEETATFVNGIRETLDRPIAPDTIEQPGQRFSGPLANYKNDDLARIQLELDALAGAIRLYLGTSTQSPAKVADTQAPTYAGIQAKEQASGASEADDRKPTSISVFLQSVGKAVIEAQGELDKSLTAPDNTNASAAYRIPKLSAEIAFEVEKADESGVNILLASRSSSERESLKQKVCFDIVAVPLPAELSVRNQLAEIILNRLPEGDPWRERLAGATLLRQARGTLALSLAVQGQDGPSLLVAPDSGDTVKGPLKLEPALGKALASILAKV